MAKRCLFFPPESFVPYSPLWKNMYNNFVPSFWWELSTQQPKNVTHVLWRNINTAEQFKTGGVTDRKITIGNSNAAPLEALRLFTLSAAGRQRREPKQCQCLTTGRRQVPRDTPISTETTLMLAWRNKCTKQKLDNVWQVSVLLFQNRLKKEPKNSRGYENIQLSAGDGSRLQVHFTTVHLTGHHHGVVQRDPWIGALLVGFLCCMLQKQNKKKDNRACVLH